MIGCCLLPIVHSNDTRSLGVQRIADAPLLVFTLFFALALLRIRCIVIFDEGCYLSRELINKLGVLQFKCGPRSHPYFDQSAVL